MKKPEDKLLKDLQDIIDSHAFKWRPYNEYNQEWHIEQANFENLVWDLKDYIKNLK